ncbi:MAG: RNA polymerase sigma factor [Pirellulaceae bacterium]|mgnify:FL=1|nr:sigma-70 family RNA polymerase sigma factor [Planctomycetaceae bacterium]MDB4863884.1 sigma-70 family RNA polymerase sigma factor [Pirellulaceae bacterium]
MNPDPTDVNLVQAAKLGDRNALIELIEQHQNRLYRALIPITNNAEEALDVTQETFVQVFRKLSTFQEDSHFFTWIYRIGFNIARTRQRRQRPDSIDTSQVMIPSSDQSAEQRLENHEFREALKLAIAKLPEDQQQVILLREIEEYDYQQIASTLNISLGTVRSRLHRARAQLRELLSHWL